jgi:hypothetical protein
VSQSPPATLSKSAPPARAAVASPSLTLTWGRYGRQPVSLPSKRAAGAGRGRLALTHSHVGHYGRRRRASRHPPRLRDRDQSQPSLTNELCEGRGRLVLRKSAREGGEPAATRHAAEERAGVRAAAASPPSLAE